MSVNTAAFAGVRKLDTETLHQWEQHLTALVGHPGWEIVTGLLAQQQQVQLEQMTAKVHQQADYAHLAGIALGLKRAFDAPSVVASIAKQTLEDRQRAAEADEERA